MTIEECYKKMDGDFEAALAVLASGERVRRYLLRFAEDPTARMLFASLADGRMEDALRAAHTLKGLCRGLGLTALQRSSAALTQALREGGPAEALAEQVRQDYGAALRAIDALAKAQ